METINLLTPSELADILKVTKPWIYYMTRKKGPEAIPRTMVGKHMRFELDKVMTWLRNKNNKLQ